MIDKSKDIAVKELIAPATLTADNTPTAVDVSGARDADIIIGVGIGGITFTASNKIEFVLTHSNDDATYENVTDADVVGVTGVTGGIVKTLKTAHAAADVTKIGYVGNRKYVKLLADFSGTHGTGTAIAAYVLQTDAYLRPTE